MTCFGQRHVSLSGMSAFKSSVPVYYFFFPLSHMTSTHPNSGCSISMSPGERMMWKLPTNPEKHGAWARNKTRGFKPLRCLASSRPLWLVQPEFRIFWQCKSMKLYSIWLLKHIPKDFLSHTKPRNWRQKSCRGPPNSLKTFQSNEVQVWPSYASLRTAIVLPRINLSQRHSDLKQKLLNFWLATHDSTAGKKVK